MTFYSQKHLESTQVELILGKDTDIRML